MLTTVGLDKLVTRVIGLLALAPHDCVAEENCSLGIIVDAGHVGDSIIKALEFLEGRGSLMHCGASFGGRRDESECFWMVLGRCADLVPVVYFLLALSLVILDVRNYGGNRHVPSYVRSPSHCPGVPKSCTHSAPQ